MSYLIKSELLQNQNTWHRGQIRIPPTLNKKLNEFADENNLSLNSAMIELMDKGLIFNEINISPPNIRIYTLKNGVKRVVFGKLVNSFDIDYTNENLSELKDDIDYCLKILCNTGSLKDRLMFINKDVFVYEGGHHLDIVNNGKGSLHWLTIEDHYVPNT